MTCTQLSDPGTGVGVEGGGVVGGVVGVEGGGVVGGVVGVAGTVGVIFSLGACVKFSLGGVGVGGAAVGVVLGCPQLTIETRGSRRNKDTRNRQINFFISAPLHCQFFISANALEQKNTTCLITVITLP